jgi:antitoxin MazE
MRVSKWGNSLAVRLPAAVVEALGLKEGDMLEIQVAGRLVFEVAKAPNARELIARNLSTRAVVRAAPVYRP